MTKTKYGSTPFVAFTSSGERLTSNEGSLTKNLVAISKKLKGKCPTNVKVVITKKDNEEFLNAYNDNRSETPTRVKNITRRMNNFSWVEHYPTFMISTDGVPLNGRHTALGFKGSSLDRIAIIVGLGVDPAVTPHIDRNKTRSPKDNGHYLRVYEGIPASEDQTRFMATAGWIVAMLCRYRGMIPGTSLQDAKNCTCDSPEGRAILLQVRPLFVDILRKIEASQTNTLNKLQFYVPTIALKLIKGKTIYSEWVDRLIMGDSMERDDMLLTCRNHLLSMCHNSAASSRDSGELVRCFATILAYLYSKETGNPLYLLLPTRRVAIRDDQKNNIRRGDLVKIQYSDAQVKEDRVQQRVILRHFLDQISL